MDTKTTPATVTETTPAGGGLRASAPRWEQWDETGVPCDLADRLRATGLFDHAAVECGGVLADELAGRVDAQPAAVAVDRFLAAGESWQERLDRRAVLGLLEFVTALPVASLPWPGWQPPDPNLRRRVLRPLEMGMVRLVSHSADAAAAAAVALFEAGAASGELALLGAEHVRTGGDGAPEAVALPGAGRASYPRQRALPGWARPVIAARLARVGDEPLGRLLYRGESEDPAKQQSSVLMNVKNVLARAGLAGDATVKPLSVRNTAARVIYDREGLEPAAAAVGASSYDALAREIGLAAHKPARRR